MLFAVFATGVLAFPGLDQYGAGTLRSAAQREEALKRPFGWWSIASADLNRWVRLPVVRVLEPLQRPLRIAQAWALYGGGPGRVRRLEIRVDGQLVHRSKDPSAAWLAPTLKFRRIRPIVSAICGKRSKNTDNMLRFVAGRVRRDFPDAREAVVECTSSPWPGTDPQVALHYRMAAPDWEVTE
ncbi:MAG: hypothetical protein R3F59_29365 [Myxococcota bacterium]